MSLFTPKYVTPSFSCSPFWCLRKCHVLPGPAIAAEPEGVPVPACTSCNLLTGFKQAEIRLALQGWAGARWHPRRTCSPCRIAKRGFCCHLTQKRLWRAGAELVGRVPSRWTFLLVLSVIKRCRQSSGKAALGLGSLGDDSLAVCSVDLWVYEPQSYSWCPTESVCVHNGVGFPLGVTKVTQVRLALWFTFLNTNVPGNQCLGEDPPLRSWIVANFRSDTQLPKIFLQKILVSKHLTDFKFPSNRISETVEYPYD